MHCSICQTPIASTEIESVHCPQCRASYHADCWKENQGCAIYGCPQVPDITKASALEIPVSYWGKENKPCPVCGEDILAMALRCRHCGTVFSTANPMDKETYQQKKRQKQHNPALRRRIIWLVIFCLFPFTAPIAAFIGFLWYRRNRADIRSMSSVYSGLCQVGMGAAMLQILVISLMVLAYLFFN